MTVLAATAWRNNAELIVACRQLGYLGDDLTTLDPTYGRGKFWALWRPAFLVAHDLLTVDGVDFRALPEPDESFDAVVFDPPYKLNGTPTESVDERFGVHVVATRAERMQLCLDGIDECARVVKRDGTLLVKCQDQVNGGRVRWQSREFADRAESHGMRLVDQLLLLTRPRPQPHARQMHAARNYSTMLILRKDRR